MKQIIQIMTAAAAVAMLQGCIHNDIPYPRIQANFLSFEAEGTKNAAAIDSTSRVITLTFPEETDIYDVEVSGYSITPGAHIVLSLIHISEPTRPY